MYSLFISWLFQFLHHMFVRWRKLSWHYRLSWSPSQPPKRCSWTRASTSLSSSRYGRSLRKQGTSACKSQMWKKVVNTKSIARTLLLTLMSCFAFLVYHMKYPNLWSCFLTRSPLPHNQRSDTDEVCLFTRDEPNMTGEQTQRFYKRLLEEKGINIAEVLLWLTVYSYICFRQMSTGWGHLYSWLRA